jgi:hypothetical protein
MAVSNRSDAEIKIPLIIVVNRDYYNLLQKFGVCLVDFGVGIILVNQSSTGENWVACVEGTARDRPLRRIRLVLHVSRAIYVERAMFNEPG